MRVYFDNVIASGRVLGDLPKTEMDAVREIEVLHLEGRIKRVTSLESHREQKRTKDPVKHAKLADAANELSAVSTDYAALAALVYGESAVTAGLRTSEEALFSEVTRLGLKEGDARHLVNAVRSACVRFLTLDRDFLDRRAELETACGCIRIVRPSELVAELRASSTGESAG